MKLEVLTENAMYISCNLAQEAVDAFVAAYRAGEPTVLELPENNSEVATYISQSYIDSVSVSPDEPDDGDLGEESEDTP